MPYLGEIAALATALCWTFTSLFFTEAAKRIGAFRVNSIRLLFAVVIYAAALAVSTGRIWPQGMNDLQFFWLALSALIGLVIGDGFGFRAFVLIGPRLTTLMWSTTPIMVTIIAWIFLGEQLHLVEVLGILITVGGVSWVVAERRDKTVSRYGSNERPSYPGPLWKGVIYGLLAALGQGVGLIMSKEAMLYPGGEMDALPASFVRMFTAMIMIWLLSAVSGRFGRTLAALKDVRAMGFAVGGAVFGPFMGVWMSLVAVKLIETGIASTLNAMTPIFIIPVIMVLYKEKVSLRAAAGAVLAVLGVAVLFLSDEISGLL